MTFNRFATAVGVIAAMLRLSGEGTSQSYAASAPFVTYSTVTSNGYGTNDLNAVGIIRDNLITVGNYQYMAYFAYTSNTNAPIYVARRLATDNSANAWTSVNTGYADVQGVNSVAFDAVVTNAIDDHDVVAMAVDGNGQMHLSWGMHNVALNYSISNSVVNGSTFNPTFTKLTSTTPTALPPNSNSTTYPEFYYEPNGSGGTSGNLLFLYRNGGAGNGNEYVTTYNAASKSFVNDEEVLNGTVTSVNGYQNSVSYDSKGNLLLSWVWRGTSGYQTNQGTFFAQSPNNGVSWYQQGGSIPYALPIVSSGTNPAAVGQSLAGLAVIPNGTSLINATTTAVDANNNPIIATWYTPAGSTSQTSQTTPESGTGNPNRQYMLVYYTGTQWKTSQIGNRTGDTAFDGAGSDVRGLARPLVLVDKAGRVLVVTRSENNGLVGGAMNASIANNDIVVYWNTIASLDSNSPNAWQSITLDTANMGEWEPYCDTLAWSTNNQLEMLYEPVGLTSSSTLGTGASTSTETTASISVLQWNEPAYFASLPEPAATGVCGAAALLMLRRRRSERRG